LTLGHAWREEIAIMWRFTATTPSLKAFFIDSRRNTSYKIDYIGFSADARSNRICFIPLVGAAGFEPATPCAQVMKCHIYRALSGRIKECPSPLWSLT
jgi:hypothetical protein